MGPDAVVELTTRANPRARVEPGVRELAPATKLVVNSAYGYLAAGGELTRFADVHEANEVTRHGRETLPAWGSGRRHECRRGTQQCVRHVRQVRQPAQP